MCWRNGIWHPCVKIASPANTFAIISSAQRGVAQAALRPPYGARRQHLHEGWAEKGGNYNYCDFPFYRVYCIIIMWWESMMAVASADICGAKERVFGVSAWAFHWLSAFFPSFIHTFFFWVFSLVFCSPACHLYPNTSSVQMTTHWNVIWSARSGGSPTRIVLGSQMHVNTIRTTCIVRAQCNNDTGIS